MDLFVWVFRTGAGVALEDGGVTLSGGDPLSFKLCRLLCFFGVTCGLEGTAWSGFASGTGPVEGKVWPGFAVEGMVWPEFASGTGPVEGKVWPGFAVEGTASGTGPVEGKVWPGFAVSGTARFAGGTGPVEGKVWPGFAVSGTARFSGGTGPVEGKVWPGFAMEGTAVWPGSASGTGPVEGKVWPGFANGTAWGSAFAGGKSFFLGYGHCASSTVLSKESLLPRVRQEFGGLVIGTTKVPAKASHEAILATLGAPWISTHA